MSGAIGVNGVHYENSDYVAVINNKPFRENDFPDTPFRLGLLMASVPGLPFGNYRPCQVAGQDDNAEDSSDLKCYELHDFPLCG